MNSYGYAEINAGIDPYQYQYAMYMSSGSSVYMPGMYYYPYAYPFHPDIPSYSGMSSPDPSSVSMFHYTGGYAYSPPESPSGSGTDPSLYQLSYEPEQLFVRESRYKKKCSKSAYILALIQRQQFIEYGARELSSHSSMYGSYYRVYYVLKSYDGSVSHETCALIGIRIQDWNELLVHSDGSLLSFLRSSIELQHIQDIYNLSTSYIEDILFKFRYAFRDIIETYNPDDLLLFNIEPRGNGRLERSYPVPLLTIPGGGMEDADYQSFEHCGLREFHEETGINLDRRHVRLHEERVVRKKHKKYTPSSYQMHMSHHPRRYDQSSPQEYSNISMFYLVRITESIMEVSRPPGL